MLSYSIYLTDWAITSLFFAPLGWLTFMEFRNKKQISCAVRVLASISAQYTQTYGFFNFLCFTPVKNWCIHLENESCFFIHKLVLNIFKQINVLVVGEYFIYGLCGLHFPRDHPGDISSPVLSSTPPSLFPIILWHLLKQTHVQNTSLILWTFVPSLSEIVFFFGRGGACGWMGRAGVKCPSKCRGTWAERNWETKWRRLKRMRKQRRREGVRTERFRPVYSFFVVFLCYHNVQSYLQASSITSRWENGD